MTQHRVPFRVETPEEFERFAQDYGHSLIQRDDTLTPSLVWTTEDGEWYGIRPVAEDDGPWADLPPESRKTLAVRVDLGTDDDSFMPFTVLWHDSLPTEPDGPGVDLIADERHRQVHEEGYTPEHDAAHGDDLALAGAAYALTPGWREVAWTWPWGRKFWKPTPDDRVRELVKAGSLIAAAIDALKAKAE